MNDVVYYIAWFMVFREPETWRWHQLQQRMQSCRAPLAAAALWAGALSDGRWRARGKLVIHQAKLRGCVCVTGTIKKARWRSCL